MKNITKYLRTSMFVGCLLIATLSAQTLNVDSLKIELTQSSNKERVEILNKLTNKLIEKKLTLDVAFAYATEADSLSNILNYKVGQITALKYLGIMERNFGNYSESFVLFEKGSKLCEELTDYRLASDILHEVAIANYRMGDYEKAHDNFSKVLITRKNSDNKLALSNTLNEMGNANLFQGNYTEALTLYYEALQIRKSLNNQKMMAQTLNNIGIIFMYQENFDEALVYLNESLQLKIKSDTPLAVARGYNNIGLIHELKEEFDEALKSYNTAMSLLNPDEDQRTITSLDNNIGLIYSAQGIYDKALYHLMKSLKAKEIMGEKMDIAQSLTSIGKAYRQKGSYQKSIEYGSKGLQKAFDINSKKEIQEAAENLHLTYLIKGDYKNTFKYYKIASEYSDSLRNDSQSREIGRLEAKFKYDGEKAEAEKIRLEHEKIEEIEATRIRTIIISGFVVLIIILIGGIFYVKSLGRKNRIITEQKNQLEITLNQLKEAQSQLVQSEKMASLGVLTAGVAHEINNPVNFITTSINALKGLHEDIKELISIYDKTTSNYPNFDSSKITEFKEVIEFDEVFDGLDQMTTNIMNGAERTADIAKGLRVFSSLEEHDKRNADIHENIDSTILMLESKMGDSIELIKDYGDIPEVQCFPGKMNQVFMNLLNNAIDAIEKNPEENKAKQIIIKTNKIENNDFIKISITDTGIGIPDDIIKKIFDPFFTTKKVGEGTGLGLSISYGIIQEHNGELKVFSEKENFTRFEIDLPIIK